MTRSIGVREAKARLSHYIDVARTEGDVVITDRGEPVARLSGIRAPSRRSIEEVLDELAEAGTIELGSSRGEEPRVEKPRAGRSVSEIVREMRR